VTRMTLGLLAGILVCLFAVPTFLFAESGRTPRTPSRHRPHVVSVEAPQNLHLLNEAEIIAAVSGKVVMSDPRFPGAFPISTSEAFGPGGKYRLRAEYGIRDGVYVAASGKLCTSFTRSEQSSCRYIYRGPRGEFYQQRLDNNRVHQLMKILIK
jgi:hypothetical protein